MIVVTANLFRAGQGEPTELLHVAIENRGRAMGWTDRPGNRYFAHVVARPSGIIPVVGFEADVNVDGHERSLGVTPLLTGILNAVCRPGLASYKLLGSQELREISHYESTNRWRR